MLDEAAIRRLARELGVRTDYAEKDYLKDRRKAPPSRSAGLPTERRKHKRVG